jgi:hypothetical protein
MQSHQIPREEQGGPRQGSPSTMSCLNWNCRGLGNTATVKELRDLMKQFTPIRAVCPQNSNS